MGKQKNCTDFSDWVGRDFIEWCASDCEDERKINYTLKLADGSESCFSSNDLVDFKTLALIRSSVIEHIELKEDEWFAVLKC